jgi:WD40 repeat protein
VCGDYVGGLALLPGGAYVAAASADGAVRLLEWRRNGEAAVEAHCGAPLRCCASDGRLLIAGGEAGQLHLWDVAAMTGQQGGGGGGGCGGTLLPGPDGFYPPVACESRAPVNGLSVCAPGGGGDGEAWVAAAQDDGTLALFAA